MKPPPLLSEGLLLTCVLLACSEAYSAGRRPKSDAVQYQIKPDSFYLKNGEGENS